MIRITLRNKQTLKSLSSSCFEKIRAHLIWWRKRPVGLECCLLFGNRFSIKSAFVHQSPALSIPVCCLRFYILLSRKNLLIELYNTSNNLFCFFVCLFVLVFNKTSTFDPYKGMQHRHLPILVWMDTLWALLGFMRQREALSASTVPGRKSRRERMSWEWIWIRRLWRRRWSL